MNKMKRGAHMSIAGGLYKAIERATEIDANSLQIFSKSPRGWLLPQYSETDFELVRQKRQELSISGGIVHSNYLANLAKPFSPDNIDIVSILHDFTVAYECQFPFVNVHIGKGSSQWSYEDAIKNMVISVEYILSKTRHMNVQYLFENTAGQGSEIGYRFEQLGQLHSAGLKELGVKYCIDTAHLWGGGYDLNKFDSVLDEFDANVGLDAITCIHLNDSKALCGTRLDRHASLGRGAIGLPALSQVIKFAYSRDIPLYIETPEDTLRKDELTMIEEIARDEFDIDAFHALHYKTQLLKKFENQELF